MGGRQIGRVGLSPPLECQHHRTPSTYLHCTARGRPTSSADCCFAARPANCWLLFCYKACAGQIICRLCLPAAAWFCGLCLLACSPLPCHAHCPSHRLPPVHFALPSVHSMCARINSLQAARTVLLAAATRACSGGPCIGFDSFSFPAGSIDSGPWLV